MPDPQLSAPIAAIAVFLLAMMLDLVGGGSQLLGRLPGPDALLFQWASTLRTRLNKAGRSAAVIRARAAGVCLVMSVVLFALGALANILLLSLPGSIIAAIFLALIIGQKVTRQAARDVLAAMQSGLGGASEDRFAAARWAIERLAFRFGDGLVANLCAFAIGGFALLLPFRFLSMLSAVGAPSGQARSSDPFDQSVQAIFQPVAFIPACLARGFVAAAIALHPNGRPWSALTARSKDKTLRTQALTSRRIVMAAYLFGMAINTALDPAAPSVRWMGPEGGRARLSAADIARALSVARTAETIVMALLAATLLAAAGYWA